MKEVVAPHDKRERYFEDEQTKAQYRRIVAGLSGPVDKPGFVVVVAEDLKEDRELEVHHLRVLGEAEDLNPMELFRKSLDLRARYRVQEFLGDREDKGNMDFLKQFNRNPKSGTLYLRNAPLVEDSNCLNYYAKSIKHRLPSDGAFHTLHFDETSKLPGYLENLKTKEVSTATNLDHPAIAALGFAVAYLDTSEYRPPPTEWKTKNIAKTYFPNPDYNRGR